jgi:hypothetical protein
VVSYYDSHFTFYFFVLSSSPYIVLSYDLLCVNYILFVMPGGGGIELWNHIIAGKTSFKNKCLSLEHNTNNLKWIDDVEVILVGDRWEELRDSILSGDHRYVLLKGKSGRGKSVFLIYLIYFILNRARTNEDNNVSQHVKNPVIIYVDRLGVIHRVTLEKVEITTVANYFGAHYFFSDNVDIAQGNLASQVCLGLTCGDKSKFKEFNKRMAEMNATSIVRYMMSFSVEEMKALFNGKLNEEEIQFRFDVVGGNPRKFMQTSLLESIHYFDIIHAALKLMFGQDYVPDDSGNVTEKQRLGQWAERLIQHTLETSDDSDSTDSSLFKDYYFTGNPNGMVRENYATTFMGIVGGGIYSHLKGNLNESLKRLFGISGFGNAFEFSCHGFILNSVSNERWCFNGNYETVKLALGQQNKVLIRNVADIEHLKDGDYGLPTVCNFPLVDAVIKPDIVLQMTIGDRRERAIHRAGEIADAMGISTSQMKMVFVVPIDHIETFSFPPGLAEMNVPMYLTSGEHVSKAVLLQHKPSKYVSAKRKASSPTGQIPRRKSKRVVTNEKKNEKSNKTTI